MMQKKAVWGNTKIISFFLLGLQTDSQI